MAVELYGWGANSHGQLGLGYQSEQSIIPEKIDLSKANINPTDIKCIVGGAGHTLILDNSGHLFGCGWNNKGQVGIPAIDSSNIIPFIEPINSLNAERIINIVCGWDSSIALTENGEIYSWGSNYYGQLGIKKVFDNNSSNIVNKCINQPTKILIDKKIKRISMGLRHSAVVTDDGQVLVTGSGNKFQLGVVDKYNQPILSVDTFTPVPKLENIVDIACGQYFTMALDIHGDIFTWGNNKYNQLGVDNKKLSSSIIPIKLEKLYGIKTIAAGWTHANLLLSSGIYFAWGRNDYGQLGNCLDKLHQWRPNSIEFNQNIQQLCVGSEHNIALDEEGKIYTWGWNEHGNCGNGNIDNVFQPCQIYKQDKNIGLLIGCGAAHSFAVIKKNIIGN